MDFRKFGIVVVVLGMLIAVYGGVQLAMNHPVEPELSGGRSVGDLVDNAVNALDAVSKNRVREPRRRSATKVVLVGGVIVLLGFGIRASAKDGSVPVRS
jgi:hypothetical protein